jgi:hypothetical protein
MVGNVVGLVDILDKVRSDPDNLYMTTVTEGGLDNAIWPTDGSTNDMQQGQSVFPEITVDFPGFGVNISLFDFDDVSDDDLLASITILESEQGEGVKSKLGRSEVEGSVYYVTYQVD